MGAGEARGLSCRGVARHRPQDRSVGGSGKYILYFHVPPNPSARQPTLSAQRARAFMLVSRVAVA